jgi:hypothetical protein
MGIKFHCPNGHKLNVKSFLAGKKGVCPKCGTKVRIPTASEPSLANADLEEADASAVAQPGGNGSPMPAAVATAQRTMAPAVPVGTPVGASAGHAAPAAIPAPAAAPGGVAVDPIAEAPAAIWYVRPPGGGQYGPARGDVMRRWIAEGRVSGDSLVWREGWTDWRNAAQLFPSLLPGAAVASATSAAPAASVATSSRSTRTATRYRNKKSSGSGLAIAALVVLAILCVALVAVLAYVLTNL